MIIEEIPQGLSKKMVEEKTRKEYLLNCTKNFGRKLTVMENHGHMQLKN